jgi:Holliday junction resolvase RusA-like endonuclease
MSKFTIPGRLPGLNEIISSSSRHWAVAYRQKKEAKTIVQFAAKAAKIRPVEGKVIITIACYEPNRRRDIDNVRAGACKIILDALQDIKILQGDGQKYIADIIQPAVQVDKVNPRIEVEIREV